MTLRSNSPRAKFRNNRGSSLAKADLPVASARRALIEPTAPEGPTVALHAEIHRSPLNPRQAFVDAEVAELADDIARRGLLQRITVRRRPKGPGFEIAAGEKRWRAIGALIKDRRWADDKPVEILVQALTDAQLVELALAENYRRSNPNHLEIGAAFAKLMELEKITAKDVAERYGYAATFVQQHVRVHREALPADRKSYLAGTLPWDGLRQRVQNPPPPPIEQLDLMPAHRLLLAEVVHAADLKPGVHYSQGIEVGPTVSTNGWGVVRDRYLMQTWPARYGRHMVQVSYNGAKWVEHHYPELFVDEEKDAALEALQVHLGPSVGLYPVPGAKYLTAWLNGPFELSPEGQAEKDRDDAAAREREEAESKRTADQLALEARRKETQERCRLAAGDVERVAREISADAARAPKPVHPMLGELVAVTGRAFPLRIEGAGVVDANGEAVVNGSGNEDHLNIAQRWRLLVVAINAAAGFGTPGEETPAEDEEPELPGFLKRLAGAQS